MNIETYILFPEQFSNHFRRYFQNFANKEKYRRKKLFSSIHKKIPKLEFHPFKHIFYIFHIWIKIFKIDEILNEIIIQTNFETNLQSLDLVYMLFTKNKFY